MKHRRRRSVLAFVGVAVVLSVLAPSAAVAAAPVPTGLTATAMPGEEPVLTWSPLTGVDAYRVQIAPDPSFAVLVASITTENTAATPTAALAPSTYHWRVAAKKGGAWSGWSLSGTFARTALTLAIPTGLAPASGTLLDALTDPPRISWGSVPGAHRYDLEFSWSSDMSDAFAGEMQTTSWILHFLDPGEIAYWRVRSVGRDGTVSAWTAARSLSMSFTTVPGGLTPISGATVRETIVGWLPVAGAAGYDVQFAPPQQSDWDAADVQTFHPVTTTFEFEDRVAHGVTTYKWRVRARDGLDRVGPWSVPRTITRTLSNAPQLVAPADGATTGGAVRFSWQPVLRASFYRVDVAPDPSFTSKVSTHLTTETSFDFTTREEQDPHILEKGHTYFWRVLGLDRSVGLSADERPASPWSAIRSFEYLPDITVVTAPDDGASIAIPTMTWTPRNARFHRVTIKDAEGTVVDRTVTWASSYTTQVRLDPDDGPFTWFLERIALPAGGGGATVAWQTEERSFDLVPMVGSSALQLLVPAALHTLDNPRIRWTPVTGASYYNIVAPPQPGDLVEYPYNAAPIAYPDFTFPEQAWDHGTRSYQVWAYDADGDVIAKTATATWTIDRLAAPVVTSPDDCAESDCPIYAEPPTIEWEPVDGATFYSANVSLPGLLWNQAVTSGSRVLLPNDVVPASLGGATEVQLYACAANRCGPAAEVHFRKEGAAPGLAAPADGATTAGPQVTVHWLPLKDSPVAPGVTGASLSEPSYYEVDVYGDGDGTGGQADGTQLTSLLGPGTYEWRVRGQVTGIAATVTETRSFTVTWPGPVLVAPVVGAAVPRTPWLDWDATPYTESYDVEIYAGLAAIGTPLITANVPGPGYSPPMELGSGTFTWRVRSAVDSWRSSWSAERGFAVASAIGPSLVGPPDGDVDTDGLVLLDWATHPGAAAYRVERSQMVDFSSGVTSVVTGQTAWAPVEALVGTWFWRVVALGPSDAPMATSTIASIVTPDAIAPTTTAPSRALVAGTSVVSGRVSLRVGWTGSDIGTGVARYELAQQTDGGPWRVVSTNLTTTSLDRPLSTQHRYRFRVRAVDHASNTGSWSTGPTITVSRFSEKNARVAYRGSWATSKSQAFWGGAARKSSTSGATASLTFTGRSIAWVARTGPNRGKANVYVNGTKVATVDLFAPEYHSRRVVWAGTWNKSTSRKVTIRVLGTSGRPRVDLDAFVTTD